MAPTTLVDLDQLDPLPVSVRISGETFQVPGAAPLEWLWRFRQLEDDINDETSELDFVAAVRDMVADLIAIEQPDRRAEAADALSRKSPTTVLQAIRAIYAGHADPEAEDDAVPPPSRTTRKPSSRASAAKTAATPRSRSSRSSGH